MSVAAAVHGATSKRRWTPKDLGTLSFWIDASDAASITESGGAVSAWNDKSGNAYNVSQPTGGNQPSYVTNVQNGLPIVRFDGSTSYLYGGDVLDPLAGGLSIGAVALADNANNFFTKRRADATVNGIWSFGYNQMNIRVGGLERTATATASLSTFQVTTGVVDRSVGVTAWVNGTAGTQVTAGFPDTTAFNNAPKIYVGARQTGTGTAAATFADCDIGEIVASLSTWTTDERRKIEGYLAHKWGLVSSLPSDHPYKNIQP